MPEAMLWILNTTEKGRTPTLEWGKQGLTCRGPLVFASEAAAKDFKRYFGKRAKHRHPKSTTMTEIQADAHAKGQGWMWTARRNPDGGWKFAGMGIE